MTRKEQALVRELDKSLTIEMKELSKPRGWKKKDWAVFKASNFLFYTIMVWNAGCFDSVEVDIQCKPFRVLDELFWDITDMPENKTQPMSLMAVGVYTAPFAKLYEQKIPVDFPTEDIKTVCAKIFDDCEKVVKRYDSEIKDLNAYKQYIEQNIQQCYRSEISIILLEIALENLTRAMDLVNEQIEHGDRDMFFAHAKEYLKKLTSAV